MTATSSDHGYVVSVGDAPTPFNADEIRLGCPRGRTMEVLVEVAGEPAYIRRTRYIECDPEGSIQEVSRLTCAGGALGPPQRVRTTWNELQRHASFRSDRTVVEADTIKTPLGSLTCLRYSVTDGPTIDTFWFARDRPGMPVRTTEHVDGLLVQTTTMIRDRFE